MRCEASTHSEHKVDLLTCRLTDNSAKHQDEANPLRQQPQRSDEDDLARTQLRRWELEMDGALNIHSLLSAKTI